MVRALAVIFGLVLVAFGILGFFPEFTPEGHLFGIFHVNTIHNLIHLITGVIAIICAGAGYVASRNFFRIFGVIYGIIAILGFYYGNSPILGFVANNMADTWLHVAIAVISLAIGFCGCGCDPYCHTKHRKDRSDRNDRSDRI
jgi:hypothetical protein